jgi:hypothetical protein
VLTFSTIPHAQDLIEGITNYGKTAIQGSFVFLLLEGFFKRELWTY